MTSPDQGVVALTDFTRDDEGDGGRDQTLWRRVVNAFTDPLIGERGRPEGPPRSLLIERPLSAVYAYDEAIQNRLWPRDSEDEMSLGQTLSRMAQTAVAMLIPPDELPGAWLKQKKISGLFLGRQDTGDWWHFIAPLMQRVAMDISADRITQEAFGRATNDLLGFHLWGFLSHSFKPHHRWLVKQFETDETIAQVANQLLLDNPEGILFSPLFVSLLTARAAACSLVYQREIEESPHYQALFDETCREVKELAGELTSDEKPLLVEPSDELGQLRQKARDERVMRARRAVQLIDHGRQDPLMLLEGKQISEPQMPNAERVLQIIQATMGRTVLSPPYLSILNSIRDALHEEEREIEASCVGHAFDNKGRVISGREGRYTLGDLLLLYAELTNPGYMVDFAALVRWDNEYFERMLEVEAGKSFYHEVGTNRASLLRLREERERIRGDFRNIPHFNNIGFTHHFPMILDAVCAGIVGDNSGPTGRIVEVLMSNEGFDLGKNLLELFDKSNTSLELDSIEKAKRNKLFLTMAAALTIYKAQRAETPAELQEAHRAGDIFAEMASKMVYRHYQKYEEDDDIFSLAEIISRYMVTRTAPDYRTALEILGLGGKIGEGEKITQARLRAIVEEDRLRDDDGITVVVYRLTNLLLEAGVLTKESCRKIYGRIRSKARKLKWSAPREEMADILRIMIALGPQETRNECIRLVGTILAQGTNRRAKRLPRAVWRNIQETYGRAAAYSAKPVEAITETPLGSDPVLLAIQQVAPEYLFNRCGETSFEAGYMIFYHFLSQLTSLIIGAHPQKLRPLYRKIKEKMREEPVSDFKDVRGCFVRELEVSASQFSIMLDSFYGLWQGFLETTETKELALLKGDWQQRVVDVESEYAALITLLDLATDRLKM